MKLRTAVPADVEPMLQIKAQLQLGERDSREGFLLGSSREQYQFFVQQARVLVLEEQECSTLVGFAIGIPDPILRQSDLWQRRHLIQWQEPSSAALEDLTIAYLEQLAVLPQARYRCYAPTLALVLSMQLFEQHQFLAATVVEQPVRNLAARALLARLGAQSLGTITETYPQIGLIQSLIYGVDRATYEKQLELNSAMVKRLLRSLPIISK